MRLLAWMGWLIIGVSPTALAGAKDCVTSQEFIIEKRTTRFCLMEKIDALVTPSCVSGVNTSCGALDLLAEAGKAKFTIPRDELLGGKNPGSVLCKMLGGAVFIGTLDSGSQATFCQAHDETFIDCASLHNKFVTKN